MPEAAAPRLLLVSGTKAIKDKPWKAEFSRLHYLQTPAKERLELPSREHWHRFSVPSLSRSSSLTKTKGRSGNKTRYSWCRRSNFQSSSAALFVEALSGLQRGDSAVSGAPRSSPATIRSTATTTLGWPWETALKSFIATGFGLRYLI